MIIYASIWFTLIIIVLLTRKIKYNNKLWSVLRYVIYVLSWFMFLPISFLLHPTIIYWLSPTIRKSKGKGLWVILWVFINTGRDNEEFGIANKDVAPDWYLIHYGKFKLSDTLSFWQKWWWSWRWNARNHTDNYLNFVIGNDGTEFKIISEMYSKHLSKHLSKNWNKQSDKLFFNYQFEHKSLTFQFGANEYRYIISFKPDNKITLVVISLIIAVILTLKYFII